MEIIIFHLKIFFRIKFNFVRIRKILRNQTTMKMIKVLTLIELIVIFTLGIIGFVTKNSEIVLISPFSIVLMLTVMFYSFNWKQKRIFQFLTGNFVLRGDRSDELI